MIQLILKAVSMFCRFGGPYVAPMYMPLINPLSWSTMLLCVFLPILLSKPNVLNSTDNENKSGGRAFGFAFLINYLSCCTFLCIVMHFACKVNRKVNPF